MGFLIDPTLGGETLGRSEDRRAPHMVRFPRLPRPEPATGLRPGESKSPWPILLARMYGGRPGVAVQVFLTTALVGLISMPLIVAWGLKFVGLE